MGEKKKKETKEKKLPPINEEATKLVAAIHEGQPGLIEELYDLYLKRFLTWADKRFYTTPGDIEDAWQEAVTSFYMKIKSKKLTELRCKASTFLFMLGHYWLLKNGRKLKRIWWTDEADKLLAADPVMAVSFFDDDIWEEERLLLRAAIQVLSPKCQKILIRRHFEGYKIAEIMKEFEYKNENSTAASLATCLKELKEIIKEKTKK